jgi:hypothetical protein
MVRQFDGALCGPTEAVRFPNGNKQPDVLQVSVLVDLAVEHVARAHRPNRRRMRHECIPPRVQENHLDLSFGIVWQVSGDLIVGLSSLALAAFIPGVLAGPRLIYRHHTRSHFAPARTRFRLESAG